MIPRKEDRKIFRFGTINQFSKGENMTKNDRLHQESRFIRKAVQEGNTTAQIMQMLSLTERQIKYRIKTRYSEGIANKILKDLAKNDGKEKAETIEKKGSSKSLVVDTSSLGRKGALEFITEYPRVILLDITVEEMDRKKADQGIFGKNIRSLLSAIARDKEGKYEVKVAKRVSKHVDKNVLDFCKAKEVILYTADNAMATLAKAYNIEYVIAEDVEVGKEKENIQEQEEKEIEVKDTATARTEEREVNQTTNGIVKSEILETEEELEKNKELQSLTDKDVKQLVDSMRLNAIITKSEKIVTLDNVSKIGKDLVLMMPNTNKILYVVLSEENVKEEIPGCNMIRLERGDLVFVITYKLKHGGLCIARYEITDIKSEEHAIFLGSNKMNETEEIKSLNLPEKAKNKIYNYFMLVRK